MAAVATCVTDAAVKVPVHTIPAKMDPWTIGREPASLLGGDIDGKNALSISLNCSVVQLCLFYSNGSDLYEML